MITASLKNYRIAPRKVRLAANLVRGKSAEQAILILSHASKKAADPLAALVRSALANAKNNFQLEAAGLVIKELRVDAGFVLKRSLPMSRGRAFPLKKRTSHIRVVLAPAVEKAKPAKAAKSAKAEKAAASKTN